jgi:hypothetical protein
VLSLGAGKRFDARAMKAFDLATDEPAYRAARLLPPLCAGP